ncbi:MAG: DNA-directed RNA polymerase subunit beta [Parcubacteria group bacterium]|nr:DNA-directed RNA polymerase subunit beta [Parcubacteria group bacterium]
MQTKIFSSHPKSFLGLPDLAQVQLNSYNWLLEKGLRELFEEISPIRDYTGKDLELEFGEYWLDEPKITETKAKSDGLTFEAPLRVRINLKNKQTGEIKEQEIYFGEFPKMTPRGTFVINGVERVVVSQLIRSSGVYFTMQAFRGRKLFGAKIIPNRGAWLEFETDPSGAISVKIDRRRKVPVTSLLRVFGLSSDDHLLRTLEDVDQGELKFVEATLKHDPAKTTDAAYIEIYKRVRPGDLATVDNARSLIDAMFTRFDRYDLADVGRYKLNQRFGKKTPIDKEHRLLSLEDLTLVLKEIIRLNNDPEAKPDDIDHLGNRRVRAVGELMQNRMRVGLARMRRIIQDRMSTLDIYTLTPAQLINPRPFVAAVREFLMSSQLSQFMDQINPLSELEHKRRVSAMGPGGLTRERAGFEVRDVHPSHYGRICPIQTPEGQNIGLVVHFASHSRLNEFGFIETPYLVVKNGKLTREVIWVDAYEEEKYVIAHGGTLFDQEGRIIPRLVETRVRGEPTLVARENVQLIDVAPQQSISVATALIPFLEHDDANRAMMGSNMQRQAVACIAPQAPLVSTGFEERAARDSGQVVVAGDDGEVVGVDADEIVIRSSAAASQKTKKRGTSDRKTYPLLSFARTNQFTCINQRPLVKKGQMVKKGEVLADGAATDRGVLALGQNVLVAFLSWGGANYEDAIIISEKLVKEDRYTSIHIEEFVCDVRDTKLGPEDTSPDLANVSEEKLKDLDEEGVVRIGAEVEANDILVGKITPKGEAELTAEERLLRAIFGEKAKDVKDTSLRLEHGKRGRVIGVKVFSRDRGDKLEPGVIKRIHVEVAQLRKVTVGDKLAGRHGNKGVIAKILPEEDMPYLEDGTPVEIILNPLGVVSRMNIGQVLETHLGWAAERLGYRALSPTLTGASDSEIKTELAKAGIPESGQVKVLDGRTGEVLGEKVTVGQIYKMKLIHLVEDKIHMRATGPYSLITQQPLGGKAQFGGQRFGEMEVWALEGYGAAYILQEMLTIKSDDVLGRSAAYEAIIRGEKIKSPNVPASFNVLVNELKSLGMAVDLIGEKRIFPEDHPE